MGAWGTEPFQNDAALDIVGGPLREDTTGECWREILIHPLTFTTEEVVAAAYVIALASTPVTRAPLPDTLREWLNSYMSVFTASDRALALSAIESLLDPEYRPTAPWIHANDREAHRRRLLAIRDALQPA